MLMCGNLLCIEKSDTNENSAVCSRSSDTNSKI